MARTRAALTARMARQRSRKSGKAHPHSRQNHSGPRSLGRTATSCGQRRYPFHAPEPACRGVSAVSVKSLVTLENTGISYASSSARHSAVHLSPREREVLRYIAAGHTTKELAAALNIAGSTAEWHISNILV